MPDPDHNFKQEYKVKGKPGSVVSPDFTWFGFRYFSVVTNLFRYLLGIRDAGEAGFDGVTIAPYLPDGMNRLGGFQTVPKGKIAVSMLRTGDKIHFSITIPEGLPATFRYGDVSLDLNPGTTELTV